MSFLHGILKTIMSIDNVLYYASRLKLAVYVR